MKTTLVLFSSLVLLLRMSSPSFSRDDECFDPEGVLTTIRQPISEYAKFFKTLREGVFDHFTDADAGTYYN